MKKRKPENITCIVVHHTEGDWYKFKDVKDLHANKFGWEDIGYHYIIGNGVNTKEGKVYHGRGEEFVGAHVKGHNNYTLGIALIGNYDLRPVPKKQTDSLVDLLAELAKKYNINISNIKGHREFPNVSKSCPGNYVDLDWLRKKIKEKLELQTEEN